MFGFMNPSAETTFLDDFSSLSLRNATPIGVNKIRNSDFFNGQVKTGVSGSSVRDSLPGIPENWGINPGSGLSCDIVSFSTTTINSQTCKTMRLRLYGTGGNDTYIATEEFNSIVSSSGDVWCMSIYAALASGGTGLTNVSNFVLSPTAWTSANAYVNGGWNDIISSLNTTLTQYYTSFTANTTSTWVDPYLTIKTTSGQAVNCYFDICAWQMQSGTTTPTTFVKTTADTGVWNSSYAWGPDTSINNEQEYYPDIAKDGTKYSLGINPFSVSASVLTITGSKPASGTLPTSFSSVVRSYVSGVITTHRKFAQKFGYFEGRMKWSGGQGIWPAFWMVPPIADATVNGRQEIDIMEWPGLGTDPTDAAINFSLHYGTTSSPLDDGRTGTLAAGDMHTNWHIYGVDWRDDKTVFYMDRKQVGTAITTPSDMKLPMYLMLNLALGGTWPGNVVEAGQIPATMQIDYVRVWDRLPF